MAVGNGHRRHRAELFVGQRIRTGVIGIGVAHRRWDFGVNDFGVSDFGVGGCDFGGCDFGGCGRVFGGRFVRAARRERERGRERKSEDGSSTGDCCFHIDHHASHLFEHSLRIHKVQ